MKLISPLETLWTKRACLGYLEREQCNTEARATLTITVYLWIQVPFYLNVSPLPLLVAGSMRSREHEGTASVCIIYAYLMFVRIMPSYSQDVVPH